MGWATKNVEAIKDKLVWSIADLAAMCNLKADDALRDRIDKDARQVTLIGGAVVPVHIDPKNGQMVVYAEQVRRATAEHRYQPTEVDQ